MFEANENSTNPSQFLYPADFKIHWLAHIDLGMTARTDKCMGYAIFPWIAAKMQAKHCMLGITFINQERGTVNPFWSSLPVLEEGHHKLKDEMDQCVLASEILEFSSVSNRINILAQIMS